MQSESMPCAPVVHEIASPENHMGPCRSFGRKRVCSWSRSCSKGASPSSLTPSALWAGARRRQCTMAGTPRTMRVAAMSFCAEGQVEQPEATAVAPEETPSAMRTEPSTMPPTTWPPPRTTLIGSHRAAPTAACAMPPQTPPTMAEVPPTMPLHTWHEPSTRPRPQGPSCPAHSWKEVMSTAAPSPNPRLMLCAPWPMPPTSSVAEPVTAAEAISLAPSPTEVMMSRLPSTVLLSTLRMPPVAPRSTPEPAWPRLTASTMSSDRPITVEACAVAEVTVAEKASMEVEAMTRSTKRFTHMSMPRETPPSNMDGSMRSSRSVMGGITATVRAVGPVETTRATATEARRMTTLRTTTGPLGPAGGGVAFEEARRRMKTAPWGEPAPSKGGLRGGLFPIAASVSARRFTLESLKRRS
mmetsp:Transcript_1656/g.5403  ORF Transcript_1656/g.5403 Transcript_1656/m.5403 type:complete len:413 (-) Transcript_1656:535-1773(-)